MALAARASKYHAKKTVIDGIEFDSAREAKRYVKLRALEDAGRIQGLRLQVPFELVPSFECDGVKYREMRYIADFVYARDGKTVVEDTKGFRTKEYIIKRKLMLWLNGIRILEI